MDKITKPFTKDRVEALNTYQMSGKFHPFTCCSPPEIKECLRKLERGNMDYASSEGILIATEDGWICPCGKYKQDWAHSFMAQENKQ